MGIMVSASRRHAIFRQSEYEKARSRRRAVAEKKLSKRRKLKGMRDCNSWLRKKIGTRTYNHFLEQGYRPPIALCKTRKMSEEQRKEAEGMLLKDVKELGSAIKSKV